MKQRTAERVELARTYGHLYRRHLDAGADRCFYCGDVRVTLDHRPPLICMLTYKPNDFRQAGVPLVLIPSCWDCNQRLSGAPLFTAQDAIAHLTTKLESLYERKATLWSESEIEEMSPMFQTMLRARQAMLSGLHARVRHLQSRALDTHLMPVYEAPADDPDDD